MLEWIYIVIMWDFCYCLGIYVLFFWLVFHSSACLPTEFTKPLLLFHYSEINPCTRIHTCTDSNLEWIMYCNVTVSCLKAMLFMHSPSIHPEQGRIHLPPQWIRYCLTDESSVNFITLKNDPKRAKNLARNEEKTCPDRLTGLLSHNG